MQNEEDMGLEAIIRRTSDPSRSSKKKDKHERKAKFTGRTHSSLKGKIANGLLEHAFNKYNKKYAKMRRDLYEANELRQEKQEGAKVSNQEVIDAYDKVVSYNKKIAKYAVKLLAVDIKELGRAKAIGEAKRIRVPRILIGRIRWFRRLCEKASLWNATRKATKEIKETTKDYISTSIPKAIFENVVTGELKDTIDAKKIQSLRMDDARISREDRMANLRSFISMDGKTSLYPKTEPISTDVPPTDPEPTVAKDETTVTTEDILASLNNGKNKGEPSEDVSKGKDDTPQTQPRVTLDDLMNTLGNASSKKSYPQPTDGQLDQNVTPAKSGEPSQTGSKPNQNATPTPVSTPAETTPASNSEITGGANGNESSEITSEEERLIAKRNREVHAINQLSSNIVSLERQRDAVNDPDVRELIAGYIEGLKGELETIIAKGPKAETLTENNTVVEETKQEGKDDAPIVEVTSTPQEIPAVVEEAKPEVVVEVVPFANGMDNVEVKESEDYMRAGTTADLISSGLRVTPDDISRIKSETEKAQTTIQGLERTSQDLNEQKRLWKEMRDAVSARQEAERIVREKTQANQVLAGEVEQLASQVSATEPGIGRAK